MIPTGKKSLTSQPRVSRGYRCLTDVCLTDVCRKKDIRVTNILQQAGFRNFAATTL